MLRHVVKRRGISRTLEYRLYGPDGTCQLTATAKATPYLPGLEILGPTGAPVAKVHRGRLLTFDIVLTKPDATTTARIAVPRIQSMFHEAPFAVTGPHDELICELLPRVALQRRQKQQTSVWDTITDSDLALFGNGEVLGYTGRPGIATSSAPTAADIAMNVASLPFHIGKFVYRELTKTSDDDEHDDGILRFVKDGLVVSDELIFVILLFRRYDYRAMRSIE